MMLGLLFSCASSLIAGTAACGVGPLEALVAYGFAIGGATLVAMGSFEIGIWRTDRQKHSNPEKPLAKPFRN